MNPNYDTNVHISSCSMEVIPSDRKDSPYISKKNVGSLVNLNCLVQVGSEVINCSHLVSIFTLNSISCYRSNEKIKISELFSDEDSVKRAVPDNFKEIYKSIIENSCARHIIPCDRFGNFLHEIASTTTSGEQRFFILQSCSHAMSFKITHKTSKIEGALTDSWVVHFFDPNKTNVLSRSKVSSCEEFLDSSRFSLRMFISKSSYKDYFENTQLGPIESECAVYEYSDTREASLHFSTLETMSRDNISGCMIYHMMSSDISSLDIREIVRSRSFSTLSANVRREIFFAKSSLGISALQLAMEQNRPNSIRSYNSFLEELSYDENVSLLPDIIHTKSSNGVPALFMAMQNGYTACINNFGLLIDRLINIRLMIGIENFSRIFFDILLAKRRDGLSALSTALLGNNSDAVLAFGRLLDKIFILKDIVDSKKLSNMIFELLNSKDNIGITGLFYALQEGHSGVVRAFGTLIDILFVMKEHIPDADIASMIFRLLNCKNNNALPGLFLVLQNGHVDTVHAFSELLDKLLIMKDHVSHTDMAYMIFELLIPKADTGVTGLFFALQEGHTDTVIAFGGIISKFLLLRYSIPERMFNSMMLDILMARRGDNIPGIFISLAMNNIDIVGAYSSLLVYAPKEVRKEVFCIKDSDGFPALYALMANDNPQSLIAYDYFLQSLSCDEQIDLLPELLISKNDNGDYALFVAMQEGYKDCVDAYGVLIENQLMTIRGRMSPDDFASIVLDIVLAKRNDGISALLVGMYNNKVRAVEAYSGLLDKVLLLLNGIISPRKLADIIYILISHCSPSYDATPMFTALHRGHASSVAIFSLLVDKLISMRGCISHDELVNMIFKLLKARNSTNIDGLFMALQEGNTASVAAFGVLLDRFISMKGYIEDIPLADMLFDLLMCKSGDDCIPGLFMAMQEGHHGAVDAFGKLLEKAMIFKDCILSEFFNSMLLDTVISKRSDGISGLFVALKNNLPEVIRSYGLLLKLIPQNELTNVLIASNSYGVPAALFAGREALASYLEIVSGLPTRAIYDLYSQLSSIRISIRYTPLSNSDLDRKYELLLKDIEELARTSRQNY
ncbi:ShET2/EspL2 family type III secretion system effector toxin [Candidatus Ichthyocystis sparus]|uniref:ShET2/EspL2 family type III secretion system effector toxin n=1 Tax=Candidatus Ichthyocystis sparus TaxID=1561004 RepID=UPI000B8592AB|nr:ShET2/EspL2 family type III secretion system effector toxin [Candidatus Ichthyocystis sparus]